ncbi:hypothetical protein GALMADRAFT_255482 [Galerina marginata CBS 339.88]|uniref:Uncharacterized protein n=1 Tax=Galerina marginata (strain CBS 339.88) TaxID=685588 RepID=A0A067SGL9_GALM3|nr:hypothetical protein GALMADRAFT_255482 [Galerina marginata CBS 339.88]
MFSQEFERFSNAVQVMARASVCNWAQGIFNALWGLFSVSTVFAESTVVIITIPTGMHNNKNMKTHHHEI